MSATNLVAYESEDVAIILFTTPLTNSKELLKLAKELPEKEQFIYCGGISNIVGLRCSPKSWEEYIRKHGTEKEVQSFNHALEEAKTLYIKEQQSPATETFTFENSDVALEKITDAFKQVEPEIEVKGFSWIQEKDGINKLRLAVYSKAQDEIPQLKGIDVSLEIYKIYTTEDFKQVKILIHTESEAVIPVDLNRIAQLLRNENV